MMLMLDLLKFFPEVAYPILIFLDSFFFSLFLLVIFCSIIFKSMSQIWHQLDSSIEGGFRKGTMASAHLDAKHFSSSFYVTGAFQAATPVLELRGRESE